MKENFPFEGDDGEGERERGKRVEMQCGSSAICCGYLGFCRDDPRDIRGGQDSKKLNNGKGKTHWIQRYTVLSLVNNKFSYVT